MSDPLQDSPSAETPAAYKAGDAPPQTDRDLNSLRVKVAELCGWTKIEWYEDNQGPPILHGFPPYSVTADEKGEWAATRPKHSLTVPLYPSDLNACAEFEKGLNTYALQAAYNQALQNVTGFNFLWLATAEQRCRAFVSVMEASEAGSVSDRGQAHTSPSKPTSFWSNREP